MARADDLLYHKTRGDIAREAMRLIDIELNAMSLAIDKRVMLEITSAGFISPDTALQAWYEKQAVEKLLAKLLKLMRHGKSASEKLTPHMEGTSDAA